MKRNFKICVLKKSWRLLILNKRIRVGGNTVWLLQSMPRMHIALGPTLCPEFACMIMYSCVASTQEIGAGRSAEEDLLSYMEGSHLRTCLQKLQID